MQTVKIYNKVTSDRIVYTKTDILLLIMETLISDLEFPYFQTINKLYKWVIYWPYFKNVLHIILLINKNLMIADGGVYFPLCPGCPILAVNTCLDLKLLRIFLAK